MKVPEMERGRVLVGMSGGVDSSYAAAKLKSDGYDVVGIMLKLWTEPSQMGENRCCSLESQNLAARIAEQLDIPFYVIDASKEFHQSVVELFVKDYISGKTPNPCVACNNSVRWKLLLKHADKFGIQYIATGHYARLKHKSGNEVGLWKGIDQSKDQSYVLCMLTKPYLSRTLFPLGDMTKLEVRKGSEILGLKNANKPDSQDLCFLGDMDYRQFLLKYASESIFPGEIVTEDGTVVGTHEGLPFYTIGQRKGLRIAYSKALYVLSKDTITNRLIVGISREKEDIAFNVSKCNWFQDVKPGNTLECSVKVRYKSKDLPCTISVISEQSCAVKLTGKESADITSGQIAAFYQDYLCLGGGIIV